MVKNIKIAHVINITEIDEFLTQVYDDNILEREKLVVTKYYETVQLPHSNERE